MKRTALALSRASTLGCLTHMIPEKQGEGTLLHWAPDVPTAQAWAQEQHKPILLVMAAGDLRGLC